MFKDADELRRSVERFAGLTVTVVGDYFLDRYLVIDPDLEEPSIETGLAAHQVVEIRNSPGAAGTVVNNLVALGAKVRAVGCIGDDGHGFDLRRELERRGVDCRGLGVFADRRTPTYTKPVRRFADGREEELSRLDVHNSTPLSPAAGEFLLKALAEAVEDSDAVMVLDQVVHPVGGVVTKAVRKAVQDVGVLRPDLPILADSRARAGEFRAVRLKPNLEEAARALGADAKSMDPVVAAQRLAFATRRTVFLTRSEQGMIVAEPMGEVTQVPGMRVDGPIDPTGAGDSASAGILLALAAGANDAQAALVGNLAASITVQQLRTTGTASPAGIVERFAKWK